MAKSFTIKEFFKRFPTDDACLDHLMEVRYGNPLKCAKCGKEGRFLRIRKIPAYSCAWCGHHIHPMAGTPFERSSTSLQKWFYAMYLFTTTRNGVAAKELQRQLGVTYKTAWRMGHEIRKYMAWVDGDAPLGGGETIVEADKAFIGGHDKQGEDDKTVVFGMVERRGEVMAKVVPSRRANHVIPHIIRNVRRGSKIATDEAKVFGELREHGYRHGTVNHAAGQYVNGAVHTNTIEAFWGWLKRGINGTHVHVSPQHLQKYVSEFEFRFNLRKTPHVMFDFLLLAFPRP